jgi:hypothetical protein
VDAEAEALKERYRKYAPELSLLLWAVWDPIGAGVPLDEYDTYVPLIWKLLDENAGVDAVSAELTRIGEERMGMDRGTGQEAAQRLTAWWYWRFDFPEEFEANS